MLEEVTYCCTLHLFCLQFTQRHHKKVKCRKWVQWTCRVTDGLQHWQTLQYPRLRINTIWEESVVFEVVPKPQTRMSAHNRPIYSNRRRQKYPIFTWVTQNISFPFHDCRCLIVSCVSLVNYHINSCYCLSAFILKRPVVRKRESTRKTKRALI